MSTTTQQPVEGQEGNPILDLLRGLFNREPTLPPIYANPPGLNLINTVPSEPRENWYNNVMLDEVINTPFARDTLSQLFTGPYNVRPSEDPSNFEYGGSISRAEPRTIFVHPGIDTAQREDALTHELVHSSEFLGDELIPLEVKNSIRAHYNDNIRSADIQSKQLGEVEAVPRAFEVGMRMLRGMLDPAGIDSYDIAIPGSKLAYEFLKGKIKDTSKEKR